MSKNNLLQDKLTYNGNSHTPTHLHLCAYDSKDVEFHSDKDFNRVTDRLKPDGINWIQIHGLQDTATIQQVCAHFDIDFLVMQDILNAKHLTKIEQHDNYNVVIIKLLIPVSKNEFEAHQLSIIQGCNYVLTFVEKETEFFNEIIAAIQRNVLKVRNRTADFLLSVILNSVMTHFMTILSNMEDNLEDMEEALLDHLGTDSSDIEDIQKYRKSYRLIRKTIMPLKEQINALFRTDNDLIKDENRPFFSDVNDHLHFILQSLETCRDILSALVDLYLSNNDLRMNSIMKQLTVVSSLFIPLTFFAGIWGMNFKIMPELEWRYGYVMAWVLMLVIALFVYLYFKRKKWY